MSGELATAFGFSENTLPAEVEKLIEQLDEADSEQTASHRIEATHYWQEIFDTRLLFEQSNDVLAHALRNIRLRFDSVLDDDGETAE